MESVVPEQANRTKPCYGRLIAAAEPQRCPDETIRNRNPELNHGVTETRSKKNMEIRRFHPAVPANESARWSLAEEITGAMGCPPCSVPSGRTERWRRSFRAQPGTESDNLLFRSPCLRVSSAAGGSRRSGGQPVHATDGVPPPQMLALATAIKTG